MVYNVAVIGIGKVGYEFEKDLLRDKPASHVGAYLACPEVNLAGVADVDEEKLEAFKAEHPKVAVYRSYQELMEKEKPQIVSVCTPVTTHAPIIYDVVKYESPKAIFCEKPLAHNIDAAKEMVKVCRENGVLLSVNFTRRWDDAYRETKRIIDSRSLGDLRAVVGYASREKDFPGNIHLIDALNYLSGNNIDLCRYIDCHRINYLIFELHVILSDGKIQILDNGREFKFYKTVESKRYRLKELGEVKQLKPLQYSFSQAMLNAVKDIVKSIEEKREPQCTGEDGIKALTSYNVLRKKGVVNNP